MPCDMGNAKFIDTDLFLLAKIEQDLKITQM